MPFSADGEPLIGRVGSNKCINDSKSNSRNHNFSSTKSNSSSPSTAVPGLWCVSGLGGSGFMCGVMAGFLAAQAIGEGPQASEAAIALAPADACRFVVP
jgi:glycine/D-amino acid oxidase-like deaminating enzyme